jgi:integrase
MSLTDVKIRSSQPKATPYKLFDREGLYLLIKPNGGKFWRYKYRFAGKEKALALGAYPTLSLAEARDLHLQARKALTLGNDPADAKRETKRLAILRREHSFESVAREWLEKQKHTWTPGYSTAMEKRLKKNIFPRLGHRPISEISALEFLEVVRVVEKREALDLAMRLLQAAGQIFRYAIATGKAARNPIADLRGALKTPVRKHQAYLKEHELPDFLETLAVYQGNIQTKVALKLLMLTFVRTSELRCAEWSEIIWDKAEWRIPAERMKTRDPHIVPLSNQSIAILEELKKMSGAQTFVFPSQQKPSRCMSENTMIFALYRMGYHSRATVHGFRSTASTILNENGFPGDVIERQLAHCERNGVRAAYNHAQYLPQRREMMQWWADYLDTAAQPKPTPEAKN